MSADARAEPARFFAGGKSVSWGPFVAKSDDGGQTWDEKSKGLRCPKGDGPRH
jgi:hypothetical protein